MKKNSFSAYDIAKICEVTPKTVWQWLTDSKVPYFNTAGGQRRVWRKDLIAFLNQLNIPIPLDVNGSLRILIVDDEPEIRKVILRVIQKVNPEVEVDEAKDGFEAGHKVASFLPSLVILDLKLPGVNGINVCKMIRSDPRTKKVRILAISGNDIEENRQQILNAGANDFLPKPFDPEMLRTKIIGFLEVSDNIRRKQDEKR